MTTVEMYTFGLLLVVFVYVAATTLSAYRDDEDEGRK